MWKVLNNNLINDKYMKNDFTICTFWLRTQMYYINLAQNKFTKKKNIKSV